VAVIVTNTPAMAQASKDSAGIRVVDNTRPAWTANRSWTISAQPVVDIGSGEDSLYQLATVMGAVRLSDGSIAVATMSTNNIRVYDARGRYVRAVGRRGQGPGEFRQVMGLTRRPGDTLAVNDSREEIEFYSADGKFGRGLRHLSHSRGLVLSGFHLFADGSFARTSWPQAHNAPGSRWTDSLDVIAVTKSDTSGRMISRHPAMEFTKTPALPFAQPVTFAPGGFIVADNDGYWVGYANRYEIRRHRLDGTLHLITRAPWTPTPVRDRDKERYKEFTINLGAEGGGRVDPRLLEQRKKMMDDVSFAPNLPAYAQMLVDSDRNLWVSDAALDWYLAQGFSRVPAGPVAWRVFDRDGRWLGSVTMPPRFRPMDIGSEYVLGLWRDADDVEHVRLYRLTKPGG
jgi:hypothetical protein